MKESSSGGTRRQESEASKENVAKQDSEATSKETVSDLEDSEKDSGSAVVEHDPAPSPDGRLDESDELKDAGPM